MTTKLEKQRRMELRRRIGNRVVTPLVDPPPTRRAPYLVPYACFSCRLSFKRPRVEDEHLCPRCGGATAYMGRNFKPPRLAADQWLKVEKLYRAGYSFWRCARCERESAPRRLSEVDAFIRDNPHHRLRWSMAAPSHAAALLARIKRRRQGARRRAA